MSFRRDMEDFLLYCELTKQYAHNTVRNYRNTLERFASFLDTKNIDRTVDIDMTTINQYRQFLNKRQSSRNADLSLKAQAYQIVVIRSFLKFMIKHGTVVLNPDTLELPKTRMRRIEFLTETEVQKLILSILNDTNKVPDIQKKRNQAIILTMFGSGLRLSELLSIGKAEIGYVPKVQGISHEVAEHTEDVNPNPDEIDPNLERVQPVAKHNAQSDQMEPVPLLIQGKGGKVRTTYLAPAALQAIEEYLQLRGFDENPFLFISFSKNRPKNPKKFSSLTPRMVQHMLQIYAKRLGIYKHITPHTLRHSFATKILMAGGDLRSVQTLLGHSSIATTQIYTHVTDWQIKELHTKIFGDPKN